MVTISKEDFIVMFEAFEALIDEYAGAKTIEEVYVPVYDKYVELYQKINEEKK